MLKVDPLNPSATYVQAYFNRLTNEVNWEAPPSRSTLSPSFSPPLPPANEQGGGGGGGGGAGLEGMSPEAEAAARAADAAAEVAAAAKAEGHRLLMEKATRIEASLETGETEAASLRWVLANQTYQRWYQRWYDFLYCQSCST